MALELDGVSKVVAGRTPIHPTHLTLERGTMNVLLGPTLSGKTTLMRLMAGLEVPTTGRLLWHGRDVTGMRVQDRKVAMVYQQFINYPSMTVYENIASPLRLTFIRESTIDSPLFTERAPRLGGLIEFYRSPARVQWSPTGTNMPDDPKLAQLWWQNIGDALSGAKTPQEALDALCAEQEKVLIRLEKTGVQGDIAPKMNEEQDAQVWLRAPGAPVAKLDNKRPQGETIAYDGLIKSWQN